MGGWLIVLLVVFGVLIVPFIISNYLAKSMRVPDLGTGLGVILMSILAAGTVIFAALQPEKPISYEVKAEDSVQSIAKKFGDISVRELINVNNIMSADDLKPGDTLTIPNPKKLEIKRGVDLSGGVILIYEVDETLSQEAAGDDENSKVDIDALVEALARRINPGGVKEIVIRPYGDKQVEIIIPDVDSAEVERIKRKIVVGGFLRFLIIAQPGEHKELVALAAVQPNARVIKKGKETLGEWVKIATTESGDLKVDGIDPRVLREPRPGVREVLMYHDRYRVEGSHLKNTSKGFDERMQPAVNFAMNTQGAKLFRALTSSNLPDPQTNRISQLGIIMDNELISAPTIQSQISDRGQISGRFTDEEVEELVNVLRAGRLPAVLKSEPITENQIDPLLGADTIKKGQFAITTSIIAVLAFMCIYYRFAGLVACFSLLLNLVLILALMIFIRGAFTLPGLAGLVLTVGMSVDANVLIFERIREELRRGSALRLAIRNGFSRATSTIVDANLTTLITAFVLYIFGKDQLRGFAVTLILGILMSMFTAIYCSRVIFDLAERRRWIKKLTMMQLLEAPNINLMSMRKIAAVFSLLLVIGGLGAVAARRAGMFDIDFLGGTSVQAQLKSPMPYNDVWDLLSGEPAVSDDISLTQVKSATSQDDTIWKIDTSLEDNKELQKRLSEKFSNSGDSLFVSHTVSFDKPRIAKAKPATSSAGGSNDSEYVSPTPPIPSSPATLSAPPEPASSESSETTPAESAETTPEETVPAETVPAETTPSPTDGTRRDLPSHTLLAQAEISVGAPATSTNERSETTVRFGQRITRDTLLESIQAAAAAAGVSDPPIDLTGPNGEADSAAGFSEWKIVADASPDQLSTILNSMKDSLESQPAWLSSSKVGGKVAGDTQTQAISAILISLVCIVAYLWIRFQRVIFGLSAVVALVHDVIITLGAIGLSLYLSKALGFLMIDEFKISLPVVAAFLTIIGYSLNDTIVVFDRIREVRGRSPDITEEMINTSINQTLSRTVLTSLTTLIVVLILYVFGGQGIHGFAFALLIGVLIGTYSSIFVASPTLLWMSKMQDTAGESNGAVEKVAAK